MCGLIRLQHLRYPKLIDEASRYLVTIQVRKDNPVSVMLVGRTWPEDEPMPAYLSEADDLRLQRSCNAVPEGTFNDLQGLALVAIFLGTGVTSTECRQLELDDLNVDGLLSNVYVKKAGAHASRYVQLDSFNVDCLGMYVLARRRLAGPSKYLFNSNFTGEPMDDGILYRFIKRAVRATGVTVADITPRILRNTYGRRHIASGCTNEQVSKKLGLSSQWTAARLRCTLDFLDSKKKS
jgi:site-specific recombinase XerD